MSPVQNIELTFGLEIEGYVSTDDWHNVDATAAEYGFRMGSDNSIEPPDDGNSYATFELRTDVYRYNPQSLQDVRTLAEDLINAGAKVNESCGGHIHIGGWITGNLIKDMTTAVHIIESVGNLERAIWQYSGGQKRAEGTYCKPVKAVFTGYRTNVVSFSALCAELLADKYRAVNFHTHTGKTVEFRLFTGTLSPEVLTVNIQIAAEIVRKALQGKSIVVQLENFKELSKVFPMVDTTKLKVWRNLKRAAERQFARPDVQYHPEAIALWSENARYFNDEQRQEMRLRLPDVKNGYSYTANVTNFSGQIIGVKRHYNLLIVKPNDTYSLKCMFEYRYTDNTQQNMQLYSYRVQVL